MTRHARNLRDIEWISLFNFSTAHDYLVHAQAPAFFCTLVLRPRTLGTRGPSWGFRDYLWWHLQARRTYDPHHDDGGPPSRWALGKFTWLEKYPRGAQLSALLAQAEDASLANVWDLPPGGSDYWPPSPGGFVGTMARLKLRFPQQIRKLTAVSADGRRCFLDIDVEGKNLGGFVRALIKDLPTDGLGG